ncbi:hypothetical protein ACQPXB_26640 [Amycolatopsis sp. CA-161197]|uniref:hypothetical protein n=1 Tax=Amycolatopsis sp. CA-161197 TaxID=3239922 RepID=UPI003D8FD6B7
MTRWIRYPWSDEDLIGFIEFGDDGWAIRHVELQGPDRRPVTAASLDEVLHIRDHGDLGDMQAYERQYGVLAEGDVRGWGEADQVVEISGAEFERVWVPARRALDQAGPSAHAGG